MIKFAVVGSGHIGKRHGAMISRYPEAELTAMCDIRSKEECENTLDVPFYSSIDEMLAKMPETDVVSICSPNGLHAEQSIKAIEAGCHVVIEKPMGLTKVECEEVMFKALNKGKQVFCVMQNRYSPPSQWLKGVVDQGLLGDIFMVQTNCYWNRDDRYYKKNHWKGTLELDGGTLFTQFSHFLDLMYWLFGDVTNIRGSLKDFKHQHNTEFEDSGFLSFDFVKGGSGSFNFSTAVNDSNFESSMTVIAEKGTVKVGGQYMNEVEYCNIQNYEMPKLKEANPANDYGTYKGSANNHIHVIENVVDTLLGRTNITTNALEGLKVVDIIERMYAASDRPLKVKAKIFQAD